MLPKLNLTNVKKQNDASSVISVKMIHLFHLAISKTLKECIVIYLTLGKRHMHLQREKGRDKIEVRTKRICCTVVRISWLLINRTFQCQDSTLIFPPIKKFAA